VGLLGAVGSMVMPGSALISFRSVVRPAPLVGLYSRLSTCCWTAAGSFITVWAWPNASDAPNPAIRWYLVAPSTTTEGACRSARTARPVGAAVLAWATPPEAATASGSPGRELPQARGILPVYRA